VVRSAVTLLDEDTRELAIRASTGLTADGQRARYRLGEGITGRVVDTGKPVVVPQVSKEPLLLNRAARRDRQELTFICVPLVVNRRPVGALGVDLPFKKDRDFDRSLKFYKLVAAIIAQAVKVSRMAEAERKRLVDENTHLRDELRDRYAFQHLVGTSAPIRQVYEQVTQVARTNTTVLIRGESGTGKEMIAHAIHYNSARAKKPFIKVSCAALPESLIESELFGYERGAFTGAQGLKKGRFELADGGTVFLDEIGDLSPSTQLMLLRFLQERRFERVGGEETLHVDARVIAATHKNLKEGMERGSFRHDLFYRLNVIPLNIPPLRERPEDVPVLGAEFLERFGRKIGKPMRGFSDEALEILGRHGWPGNVRELENVIERTVVLAKGDRVEASDLPATLRDGSGPVVDSRLSLLEHERLYILKTLAECNWNKKLAASVLGINRSSLYSKLKKHVIGRGPSLN